MRLLIHKDGDISSYFDKMVGKEGGIGDSSLKHLKNMLFDTHTNDG